jgi:hypothetical protein
MPKSGDSQTEQIRKLKEMLVYHQGLADRMRELVNEMEMTTKASREKKRGRK